MYIFELSSNADMDFGTTDPQYYKSRQSLSLRPSGNQLNDCDTLADFNLANECTLYFRDLGPQICWSTVRYF